MMLPRPITKQDGRVEREEAVNRPVVLKNKEAVVSQRYYDAVNRRLVYIGQAASPESWDELWDPDEATIRAALQPSIGVRWLLRITAKYLQPRDGTVLEGGCGMGNYVAALHRAGYRTIGIDFAPRTVAMLNRVAPELDIRHGDVRKLPMEDESISGYWSIGVIEHFFAGYQELAREMARVIKPGGYLFLSFPFMSPLRRAKARLGRYPGFTDAREPLGFYQFALDATRVAAAFGDFGFRARAVRSLSGLKGCKDELGPVKMPLQKLYNYPGRSIVLRGLRWALDPVLARCGCGHVCVLVLERR